MLTDNQPIASRFGDDIWLTDVITPDNPDVLLEFDRITGGIPDVRDRVRALWARVAVMPYVPQVRSTLSVQGAGSVKQNDTWLFPSETLKFGIGNCATRSFLLASLLSNERSISEVYCTMGYLHLRGQDGHAWVTASVAGEEVLLETTQPSLSEPLIPVRKVEVYEPILRFNEKQVFLLKDGVDITRVLNTQFSLRAIPFLKDYLCEKCLSLEGV